MDDLPAVAAQVARLLGSARRGSAYADGGLALGVSGEDAADLNLAIAWGEVGPDARSAMTRWRGPLVALGIGRGEASVGELAGDLGLDDAEASLPVWCVAGPVPRPEQAPASVHVAPVVDAPGLAACRAVLARSFGLPVELLEGAFPETSLGTPGLTWFLATSDGDPVACIAAMTDGPVGSLWCGGTVPEAQGRGFFTQAVEQAMRQSAGVERWWAITEAVASGRAMARVGGAQAESAHVWVRGSSVGELIASAAP